MSKQFLIAGVSALALSGTAAMADVTANASTELNLRAGPGANYESIGVIDSNAEVEVSRCTETGTWCEVTYDGATGWASATYLNAGEDYNVIIDTDVAVASEETVRSEMETTGVGIATGAIAGALIANPVGAAVGTATAVGATAGAIVGADATVEEETVVYVRQNPVEQVYLDGEVVVGAGIPEGVEVHTVPDAEYQYAYVNGFPVILEPQNRRIVRVVR